MRVMDGSGCGRGDAEDSPSFKSSGTADGPGTSARFNVGDGDGFGYGRLQREAFYMRRGLLIDRYYNLMKGKAE